LDKEIFDANEFFQYWLWIKATKGIGNKEIWQRIIFKGNIEQGFSRMQQISSRYKDMAEA